MGEAPPSEVDDFSRVWNLNPQNNPVLPDDEDFASYLRRIGFTEAQFNYANRGFINAEGDAIQKVSAKAALAEINEKSNGEGNFRVMDGYDSLAKYLAEGLDIRLNMPVSHIEWSADSVQVKTHSGVVFQADQVVITVPLGVLQAGKIAFSPELPANKQAAIRNILMGPGLKMIYCFSQPILPPDIFVLFSDMQVPVWWSPSFGHNTDKTVWTAFATGDWARNLMADGDDAALAKGLDVLRTELNMPDLQPEAMQLVNWTADPYALGAYSAPIPGYPDDRDEIARPVGRLYWAGEHTATHGYAATIHGAYVSGMRAAKEVLSAR